MSISMAWIAQIMKLNQFTSETIQNALQELIKSGRVKASICRPDFTDACNELLSLNFFTEEGQLHVINTLSQLNGNFVANIIRKGLTALRKVYNDCKTFEDESIKLVDLCLSFYQKQGRDATGTTPSPALLVECTAELCDVLLKRTGDGDVNILLSKYLVILMEIFGSFLNARLCFPHPAKQIWNPICHFKHIFDALKTRVNKEFFEEVLEQTFITARKDKELNYMNSRSIFGMTPVMLMEPWKKLLEFSFVTNWFAVQTAKQDILLHDQEHAGQCSNVISYSQSLIINIVKKLQTFHSQDCNFKIHNDKKRLQIFFSHPEIIVICTKPCVQLLQSHISTKCMDEIFHLLENKNNRVVLKSSISAESKFFEEQFKQLQNGKLKMVTATDIENLFNNWKIMRYYNQQFLENEEITWNLTLALTKVAEALLSLPDNQPVIDILTFWKRVFTDEKYLALTQICLLVHAVISLGQQKLLLNMKKLVVFLVLVPQHLLQTMHVWHSILAGLIITFPDSWNSRGTFIEHFTDKLESQESIVKTQNDTQFVERVLKSSLTETTKNELTDDVTDEQPIKQLAKLLLETNWKHDLKQVYAFTSSYLNIPRQLVFAFQEAPDKEKHHAIRRVLDVLVVLRQHFPKFLFGDFGQNIENKKFLQTLAEYDFKMLMRESSLEPQEVCNILHVYSTSELSNYISLFADGNACIERDCNWSTEYTKYDPLTPGKLAFLILNQLKEMNIAEELLQRETLTIFNQLLRNSIDPLRLFPQQRNNFNEYIEFFFNIMKISLSLSEIKQLLIDVPSSHCAVKCKDVILATFLWKSGNKDEAELLRMVKKTLPALVDQQKLFVQVAMESPHLQVLAKILNSVEHEEIIDNLLKLLFVSIPSTAACVDTIVGWSKEESLALVKNVQDQYHGLEPKEVQALDNKLNLWLQMLPFVSNVFPNSAKNVGDYFDNMIENNQLDDLQSLTRIPIWFKEMTNSKFSRQIIESWCTSLILYENLSSRDVDAIVNLTPDTIHLITKESGEIEECLFKEPAPKTWTDDHSDPASMKDNIASFKRCLQFAKILDEFACIALRFKENSQIVGKIQEGTHDLCRYFLENRRSSGGFFKVLHNVLKELFCILFSGEAVTSEDLTSHSKLCTSLVAVFRRLSRSISIKQVLFGHVKTIVHQTLQKQGHSKDLQELLNAIHKHALELEPNQDAIHFLQASGYNQGALEEDLWYSTSIQLPSYVPTVGSFQKVRTQRLLKQMMREWRSILMDLEIVEVDVNGQKIKTTDLMNHSYSLETMESQLHAIKNATQNAPPPQWSYDRRQKLIQKEKYVRRSIKEDANQMVIVWDNQLLDSVKTCTENIPGCYAPNGFHSEKPVICGIAVDSRILTLYKQEKVNTLTELEDVEVKLYPVGMLVYGVHSRSHCYDTDQLWAAFFKMLLLKRLVPKIFITNVSPGFEWIKNFVKPEESRPEGITFACCNILIPSTEDSYDYEPNGAVANLNSGIPDNAMDDLIILTPDNVQGVEFTTLKSPKRDQLIRKVMENVPRSVKEHSRLLENHPSPEIREQLIKRLTFAIRKAAELSIDTAIPETEMISNFINLKKLSSGCKDCAIIEENREDFYSEIILDVLRAEIDENTEYNRDYDCCQHVEFLQSTECTLTRD